MAYVSWGTTFNIAGQSIATLGIVGAATQYITQSAIQLYNRICPKTWQISNQTAQEMSTTAAAVLSSTAGIGFFAYKLFMQKYGRSDEMPAEIAQEYKDKKFLDKITRLLPHIMNKN